MCCGFFHEIFSQNRIFQGKCFSVNQMQKRWWCHWFTHSRLIFRWFRLMWYELCVYSLTDTWCSFPSEWRAREWEKECYCDIFTSIFISLTVYMIFGCCGAVVAFNDNCRSIFFSIVCFEWVAITSLSPVHALNAFPTFFPPYVCEFSFPAHCNSIYEFLIYDTVQFDLFLSFSMDAPKWLLLFELWKYLYWVKIECGRSQMERHNNRKYE